jgi:hypothetical protein
LIVNRDSTEHVFINRCGNPLTRFGIHAMVKRHAKSIIQQFPAIKKKHNVISEKFKLFKLIFIQSNAHMTEDFCFGGSIQESMSFG